MSTRDGAARTVLVGLGNRLRGDDAIGPAVVAGVRRRRPDVSVVDGAGDALALVAAWEEAERVIVVDAACCGAADDAEAGGAADGAVRGAPGAVPGTVHRLADARALSPKALARCSSHGGGLAEAMALAEALGRRPPALVVFAVEAASFAPGAPMTPGVARALEPLVARVLDEIDRAADTSGETTAARGVETPRSPPPHPRDVPTAPASAARHERVRDEERRGPCTKRR